MAWGKAKTQPPPPSLLRQLLPLALTLVILVALAWVGWHIYLSINQMRGHVSQRMNKRNVVFTKDGLKVGVRHVENEREVDATQRYLVNAWNLRSHGKVAKEEAYKKRGSK